MSTFRKSANQPSVSPLNLLPVKVIYAAAKEGNVEFKIDQFWTSEKPEEGAIIHGRLKQGIIKRGEKLTDLEFILA